MNSPKCRLSPLTMKWTLWSSSDQQVPTVFQISSELYKAVNSEVLGFLKLLWPHNCADLHLAVWYLQILCSPVKTLVRLLHMQLCSQSTGCNISTSSNDPVREGYGKHIGEWVGKAERQLKQRKQKAAKSKEETYRKEEPSVMLLRFQTWRWTYFIWTWSTTCISHVTSKRKSFINILRKVKSHIFFLLRSQKQRWTKIKRTKWYWVFLRQAY